MTTPEHWQDEVGRVFRIMDRYCNIQLTKSCSMHVHVSPSVAGIDQRPYTMDNIKNILKAISYFDDAITGIMPADRKVNEYAMSNFQSNEAPPAIRKVYGKVPQDTWKPLFKIFDKAKLVQHVLIEISPSKFMSWNFKHLVQPCGTVEFRRPPGVRSATAANHWVAFTLGFVSEALRADWSPLQNTKDCATVNSLRQFVIEGVKRLEQACQGALITERIVVDNSPPTVYSAAELESIKRKKAAKANMPSPFAQKVRLSPEI